MKFLRCPLLLLLFIGTNTSGMDQSDILSSLPEELLYRIIDIWPAINVYRLISRRWHALTSYEHADAIIGKLGPASLGKWDAQKLLLSRYIKNNDQDRASIILSRREPKSNHFTTNPYWYANSQAIKDFLQKQNIEDVPEEHGDVLYRAVSTGTLAMVMTEYSPHIAIDGDNMVLRMALTKAVTNDRVDIIEFLLGKLSDNDILCATYYTTAADSAHIDTIKQLCQKGRQDLQTGAGSMPSQTVVEQPAIAHINDTSHLKVSPFMQAIEHGRLEVAKLLKEYGADSCKYSPTYGLPLYNACLKGRGEAVEFLLANGVTLESRYKNYTQSFTPLWIAASENHLEIAQKLIAAGANVNWGIQSTYDGSEPIPTPLIQAAYNGHLEMVKLLVKSGAQIEGPTFNGKNAQETARAQGHLHIAQWLEEYRLYLQAAQGMDPNHCTIS